MTRHQARRELAIQKYAATFMPTLTPFPYANRQHAIVEPIAKQVNRLARMISRAVAAIAFRSALVKAAGNLKRKTYASPCECRENNEPYGKLWIMDMNAVSRESTSCLHKSRQYRSHALGNIALTTSKNMSPTLIQKAPHIVLMTVTRVSRASKPFKPAMN